VFKVVFSRSKLSRLLVNNVAKRFFVHSGSLDVIFPTPYSAIKTKLSCDYKVKLETLLGDSVNSTVFYDRTALEKLSIAFDNSLSRVSTLYASYGNFACLVHAFKYPDNFFKLTVCVLCSSGAAKLDTTMLWDISALECAFTDFFECLRSHSGNVDAVCDSYISSLAEPGLIIDAMRKYKGFSYTIVDYGYVDSNKIAEDCSKFCVDGTYPRDLTKERYSAWWVRNEEAAMRRRQQELDEKLNP